MPSAFLSRVGRALSRNRRDRSDKATSEPSQPTTPKTPDAPSRPSTDAAVTDSPSADLGGPYENVSPTASPSASNFADVYKGATPERGRKGLPAFISRFTSSSSIPPTSPITNSSKRKSAEYLQLPSGFSSDANGDVKTPTTPATNGVGLSSSGESATVDEKAVATYILNPTDALKLVRATSALIKERGLESLGIFKPNWYASSPEKQARIISLFLATLAKPTPTTGLAPTSTTAIQTFESELHYTESPHDVAEVFKWALRHLKLDGESFGQAGSQWQWYETFSESEKGSSYPSNAFSKILMPTLATTNAELLKTVLDLTSSVASHADSTAMSGSKLSKVLAWWLVSTRRVPQSPAGWKEFYAEWEFAARVLEHVFLAFVRDLGDSTTLPKRLKELITKYPYAKLGAPTDGVLLPKPRFTTTVYPAILVQLTKDRTPDAAGKVHPVALIEEALTADVDEESTGPFRSLWDSVKDGAKTLADGDVTPTATSPGPSATKKQPTTLFSLSQVFSDETLNVLSLVPATSGTPPQKVSIYSSDTPGFILSRPPVPRNRRSFSMNDAERPPIISSIIDHTKAATMSNAELPSPINDANWSSFMSGGFGEVTSVVDSLAGTLKGASGPPSATPRKSSMKSPMGDGMRSPLRVSMDPPPMPPRAPKVSLVSTAIQLDEAFIDVWTDNVTDPVPAANWPTFTLCQLKTPATIEGDEATSSIAWLVIEQILVEPPAPVRPEPALQSPPLSPKRPTPSIKGMSRFGSFMPSFRRRASSESDGDESLHRTLSTGGTSIRRATSKRTLKAAGGTGVSELGETVKEEEQSPIVDTKAAPAPAPAAESKSSPIVDATAAAVGGGIALLGAGVGVLTSVLSTAMTPQPATPEVAAEPVADTPAEPVAVAPEVAVADATAAEPVVEAATVETPTESTDVAEASEVKSLPEAAVLATQLIPEPAAQAEEATPVPTQAIATGGIAMLGAGVGAVASALSNAVTAPDSVVEAPAPVQTLPEVERRSSPEVAAPAAEPVIEAEAQPAPAATFIPTAEPAVVTPELKQELPSQVPQEPPAISLFTQSAAHDEPSSPDSEPILSPMSARVVEEFPLPPTFSPRGAGAVADKASSGESSDSDVEEHAEILKAEVAKKVQDDRVSTPADELPVVAAVAPDVEPEAQDALVENSSDEVQIISSETQIAEPERSATPESAHPETVANHVQSAAVPEFVADEQPIEHKVETIETPIIAENGAASTHVEPQSVEEAHDDGNSAPVVPVAEEPKPVEAVEEQVDDDASQELAIEHKASDDEVISHSKLMAGVGEPSIPAATTNGFILGYSSPAAANGNALPDQVVATETHDPNSDAVPVEFGHADTDPTTAAHADEHVEHYIPAADDADGPTPEHGTPTPAEELVVAEQAQLVGSEAAVTVDQPAAEQRTIEHVEPTSAEPVKEDQETPVPAADVVPQTEVASHAEESSAAAEPATVPETSPESAVVEEPKAEVPAEAAVLHTPEDDNRIPESQLETTYQEPSPVAGVSEVEPAVSTEHEVPHPSHEVGTEISQDDEVTKAEGGTLVTPQAPATTNNVVPKPPVDDRD